MTTVQVYGPRVRQARVLRRMTSKAVVEQMGWKGPRQTRLEQADVTVLERAELEQLAAVMRFPADFFTTAPLSRVAAGELLFRAPKTTTVSEKEYLASFAGAVGDFLEELGARAPLPPVTLPVVQHGCDIEKAAAAVRERFDVAADEPLGYLMYHVERAGVAIVVRLRRSRSTGQVQWDANAGDGLLEKHVGYSTRVGEYRDRPLIVLRAIDSWERTRWTVAHEVGHLVLHASGVESEDQELEASRFASELLAPAKVIRREVPEVPTLLNLIPLKSKWGISIGALMRHLFESELISQSRYDILRRQLYTRQNPQTGTTWGRTEPGFDERPVEQPRLVAYCAERGFGASSAHILAAHQPIWPEDLLEDFLAGQRRASPAAGHQVVATACGGPATVAVSEVSGGGHVVDFDQFKRSRRV